MIDFLFHTPGGLALVIITALILTGPLRSFIWFLIFLGLSGAAKGRSKLYLHNLSVSHDQHLNAQTGGDRDLTVSGRSGRTYIVGMVDGVKGWSWPIVLFIVKLTDRFDPAHCLKAALVDRDEGKAASWGYKKLTEKHWQWAKEERDRIRRERG